MIGQIILFLFILIILLMAIFSFSQPTKPLENNNSTEDILWEREKQKAQQEHEAEQNKEWFTPVRWLTDKEIDWATKKVPGAWPEQKYKILPAHQFHLTKEAKKQDDPLIFPELVKDLTNSNCELVFIPVNQTNYHWSLLVFETNTRTFYHWDTSQGANYEYTKPLVKELLREIYQDNNPNLTKHLILKHDIHQGNNYDCGVAVISIIKRIREKYESDMKNIELGEFDFKQERKELREKYLAENNDK